MVMNIHPGWAIFSVYFLATHLTTYYGILQIPHIEKVALAWVSLQVLRILAESISANTNSKLVAKTTGAIRNMVVGINESLMLGLFRINFMWTLGLSILVFVSPFAYVTYLYGAAGLSGCLALFSLVLILRGRKDLQVYRKNVKPQESRVAKKVAVVGGGTAGLMTVKEMKEQGHSVKAFESSSDIGGVWSKIIKKGGEDTCTSVSICGSRVTGKTLSSSSIINSMFGDYQKMSKGSNPSYPTHFTEDDFRTYLDSYVETFGLKPHFKTSAWVHKIEKRDDDTYDLTWRDTTGQDHTEHFDVVAVCTGLNQEIRAADNKKLSTDKSIQHTSNANQKNYKDKTVVIVGLGESSTDMAADIAKVAKHVHVIVRSPTLLLPRNTFGTNIAPDHKLTRALLHCPQYLRTMKLMSQTIMFGPFFWLSQMLGVKTFGVTAEGPFQDNWSWDWWVLFHRLSMFHPNNKGKFALTRGQVTKTAPLVEQYRKGKVSFHAADIKETLSASTNEEEKAILCVNLADGSCIDQVDEIVNATGYKTTFPFLPTDHLKTHKIQERYRLVYHPELPNMPFIGLARGSVGSIFFATELQARWAALVASGERTLPPACEMKEVAHEHELQQAGKWPTKISMVYANAIARNEIGCEPDLWAIFKTSPKAWFYLMFGPFCVSMFRFRGPGANPDMAQKIFEGAPRLVYPLEFALQQGLELVLGFLVRFWTTAFGNIKQKAVVLRQCATPFLDLNN